MKKNIIIGIIILAIIIAIIVWLSGKENNSITSNTIPMEETTSSQIVDNPQTIIDDVKNLPVDDITKEFQNIDAQIKNL